MYFYFYTLLPLCYPLVFSQQLPALLLTILLLFLLFLFYISVYLCIYGSVFACMVVFICSGQGVARAFLSLLACDSKTYNRN